jgi:hypothetical protein
MDGMWDRLGGRGRRRDTAWDYGWREASSGPIARGYVLDARTVRFSAGRGRFIDSIMADASQSFHSLGRLWSYISPAGMMFMRLLAFQP